MEDATDKQYRDVRNKLQLMTGEAGDPLARLTAVALTAARTAPGACGETQTAMRDLERALWCPDMPHLRDQRSVSRAAKKAINIVLRIAPECCHPDRRA